MDDGISGTTFDRPDFLRMIADIENGLVGTVIVKDLSRLGRDYLRVGQYTEMVFPDNNVRFISISDNIDSIEGMSDFMPFHNLINEWYARDISRKQRAVIQNKGHAGQRLTTRAIFGYKKDEQDKKLWVIDEEAAAIVRRIFALFISGKSQQQIANILFAEKVVCPSVYLGCIRKGSYAEQNPFIWSNATITAIARFYTVIDKYETIEQLTPEILMDFVDRVEVSEGIKVTGERQKQPNIAVFFIGVGCLKVNGSSLP